MLTLMAIVGIVMVACFLCIIWAAVHAELRPPEWGPVERGRECNECGYIQVGTFNRCYQCSSCDTNAVDVREHRFGSHDSNYELAELATHD